MLCHGMRNYLRMGWSMLGDHLTILSIIASAVGIIYLVWGEIEEWKKKKSQRKGGGGV